MRLIRIKKTKKDIRDVIYDDRALKKAAKASIKDQKEVTKQASRLRTQTAR